MQSLWQSGVLDPQGPVGAAQRLILLNATAIMLAIVVPVIVLTLGVAWWFRAGNTRARYLPDWEYSGPVELVVWSIPALVVMFLGGIAWIGTHDLDPSQAARGRHEAARHPGRVARLEMAVHLPRARHRQRQPSVGAGRHATTLHHHLGRRHEQLLRAAARQPDLRHGRHDNAARTCRPTIPAPIPASARSSAAAGFSDMRFDGRGSAGRRSTTGLTSTQGTGDTLDVASYAKLGRPGLVDTAGDVRQRGAGLFEIAAIRNAIAVMFGKLTWDAIPFDQPIPMAASLGVILAMACGHRARPVERLVAISVGRMDHQRRPQAARRDVRPARLRDADPRLRRRADDAQPARPRRGRRRGLPAARALQPDLLGARHDHDLLRRHAVRDRADELRRAAAARHPRRRLSGAELGELLADRLGRAAGQHLAVRRRVRPHRLAGLPAAVGARLLAGRRRRLLPVGAADLRRRHAADRHQLHHHDPEAARAGHGLRPHADLLLDGARLEPADRRRLPDPDRDLRDAAARPLSRLPLLHDRRRRPRDDVHQPDLGVGPSRGLHPGPAGLRRLSPR